MGEICVSRQTTRLKKRCSDKAPSREKYHPREEAGHAPIDIRVISKKNKAGVKGEKAAWIGAGGGAEHGADASNIEELVNESLS
eukprot:5165550-Pyramimonas_sp.AAC.1